jgi:hypothetical protein
MPNHFESVQSPYEDADRLVESDFVVGDSMLVYHPKRTKDIVSRCHTLATASREDECLREE